MFGWQDIKHLFFSVPLPINIEILKFSNGILNCLNFHIIGNLVHQFFVVNFRF